MSASAICLCGEDFGEATAAHHRSLEITPNESQPRSYTGCVLPLAAIGLVVLLVKLFVLAARRFFGLREDYRWRHAFQESPVTLIDRVETAAKNISGYAYSRGEDDRSIVLYRHHDGPLGGLEHPGAPLADATMDLLHVSAERREGLTWLDIRGRSDPRVIYRVRRSLARST